MNIAIVGMGISGRSAANLALQQGHTVSLLDSNPAACPIEGGTAYYGVDWPTSDTFDQIIVSPGVPPTIPWLKEAQKNGVDIDGELSVAAQKIDRPILAITGTNGKSSTAYFAHQLLEHLGKRSFLGGNFGTPLSDLVLQQDDFDIAVVEVSSYQLETAKYFHPKASVLLNLTPDHLARHGDMQTYAASKRRIFEQCTTDDVVITNTDQRLFPSSEQRHWRLEGTPGVTKKNNILYFETEAEQHQIACSDIPLVGTHNHWNVAAAILLCHAAGIPIKSLDPRILKPLEHRLELVRSIQGVRWVNDSKATNIEATAAALLGVSAPQIVLLGGAGKSGAQYSSLLPLLKEKAQHVICFGQSALDIVNEVSSHPNCHMVAALEDAMQLAHSLSQTSDTVLLSPACASFDAFDNFMHRGQIFREFALQLESP